MALSWVARWVVALPLMFAAATAHGHFMGGRWETTDLTVCGEGRFLSEMAQAIAAWNGARGGWPRWVLGGCPGRTAGAPVQVELRQYYDPNDYAYALAINTPAGGPFAQATIYINSVTLERLDPADRVGVLVHELGHVLGLGHNCTNSIMASGDDCPFRHYQIKSHDVEDLNHLYRNGG